MDALRPFAPPAAAATKATGAVKAGDKADDARKVAAQFETLLLGELVKAMRASTAFGEEGDGDFAEGTYQEMFDQSIVDAAAGGIGIADALTRQLGGPMAARTAGGTGGLLPLPDRAWVSRPQTQEPVAIPEQDDAPWRPNPAKMRAAAATTAEIGTHFAAGAPTPGLFPVDGGRQSSEYGYRMHPIHNERRFHAGLDIAAPEGREIRAVQRGTVVFAGRHKGYGNMVELRHPDGVVTRYAHASRLHVREGDVVDVGEAIADVGSTGQSTGPHLHFEVREGGHTIDPERYLERLRQSSSADATAAADGPRPRTGVLGVEAGHDASAALARDVKG